MSSAISSSSSTADKVSNRKNSAVNPLITPIAPKIPPIIKGGGSTVERLYCRLNLGRLVETCLTTSCQHFQVGLPALLPELLEVASAERISIPCGLNAGELILVPCSAWYGPGAAILSRDAPISTFLVEHEALCEHGLFPLTCLENMEFYVFQLTTIGDCSPASTSIEVEAVYIDTLPPFVVNQTLPLCVGNTALVSGIPADFSIPLSDNSFVIKAKKNLTKQYCLDKAIVSSLGKRDLPPTDTSVSLLARSKEGYIITTNDGRNVQRFSKETHDKQLHLTQAFIRLLWSTPAKLEEFFGEFDHRWDHDRILKAVSDAEGGVTKPAHWISIAHYPRIRNLRVLHDPDLLQACLCWKAKSSDHRILGLGDFLPSTYTPEFSTNDHDHLFAAFQYFGMVLSVFVHQGYYNILQDTVDFICSDDRVSVLPDYVLQMVFVIMIESIGKELNSLTAETGSPLWQTDPTRGVDLIKKSAQAHFCRELCLKVFDEWDFHYKTRHVAWESRVTPTKDGPSKKDKKLSRNLFCCRDVKFFYDYAQPGRPAVACSVSSCQGKHIDSSKPPKKDDVIAWLKDATSQGGKVATWKVEMAKYIHDKK